MWLFTSFGFFSVVGKPGVGVTVRSRTLGDLVRLRRSYLPELTDPAYLKGTDYPWRAHCGRADLGHALGRILADLDYTHFRDEVEVGIGAPRARRYLRVWKALYGMKDDLPEPEIDAWPDAGRKASYGGVILDPQGRLLLQQTRGQDGARRWTFPKGRPRAGEAPHETAAREALEACGLRAHWLLRLPGVFKAGAVGSQMALMLVSQADQDRPDAHAAASAPRVWLSPDAARSSISESPSGLDRERDLAILQAACRYLRPEIQAQPFVRMSELRRRPLPARRMALPLARTFNASQMAGLIRGWRPARMPGAMAGPASPWCAAFDEGMLHVHHADSGVQCFRLHFECLPEPGPDQWQIRLAELNTHPGQQPLDPATAVLALERLIDAMTAPFGGRRLTPGSGAQ